MRIEDIKKELREAMDDLQDLENQYVGHTPAQQRTLDILKQANVSYRQDKEVLTTRIQYLKALLKKQQNDDFIEEEIYKDCYKDAMLDSMD